MTGLTRRAWRSQFWRTVGQNLLKSQRNLTSATKWLSVGQIDQRKWCVLEVSNQNEWEMLDESPCSQRRQQRRNCTKSWSDRPKQKLQKIWGLTDVYLYFMCRQRLCRNWDYSKRNLSLRWQSRRCLSISQAEDAPVWQPNTEAASWLRYVESRRSRSTRWTFRWREKEVDLVGSHPNFQKWGNQFKPWSCLAHKGRSRRWRSSFSRFFKIFHQGKSSVFKFP